MRGGQSLIWITKAYSKWPKVVCAAVAKQLTLTRPSGKVYSEWPKFNLNNQSLFKIAKVCSELPGFNQNNQSLFRIPKVVSAAVMKDLTLMAEV